MGVVALQCLLVLSVWTALQTGEREEDRVEGVVAEQVIEQHEHAAERFLILSVVVLGLLSVGILQSRAGAVGRLLGTVGSLMVLLAGLQVGRSGGELVYTHGAAQAYNQTAKPGMLGNTHQRTWPVHGDDDD